MGNPITWQNVNSSDSRLAAQLLAGAQQGITGSFDKFGDIIAQREAVNQGAADRARSAAEQEFMNQLYGYKNPAELQAARESGALAQQLAGLDPRNQAAARTALDARLGTLQTQTNANDTFAVGQVNAPVALANAQATAENAPITRELARNALLSRQAVEPITQATALVTANNDQGAAKLTQKLRPLTDANTLGTATEMAAALKETARGREADAIVNASIAAYRKSGGTSDTEAKAGVLRDLASKGFSPTQIARIAPGLDLALNTGPIAPIGNDLATFNAQVAKRDAVQAQLENQYGVKTEPGSVGPLLKDGLAVIDGVLPKDSARSEIYKERLGAFLSSGGIKNVLKDDKGNPVLENGKPIVNRVLPTAAQLQVIVSGIEKKWHNTRGGWFGIGKSGMQEEIDDALQAWADSPEAQKGAAELTKLEFLKQMQTVKKAETPLPAALGGKR